MDILLSHYDTFEGDESNDSSSSSEVSEAPNEPSETFLGFLMIGASLNWKNKSARENHDDVGDQSVRAE